MLRPGIADGSKHPVTAARSGLRSRLRLGEVNDCNCSICRRYGALWAYYPRFAGAVRGRDRASRHLPLGDRSLEFHRCRTCGCVTHWSAVDRTYERMGVNARLMAPEVLAAVPVFHDDGASM